MSRSQRRRSGMGELCDPKQQVNHSLAKKRPVQNRENVCLLIDARESVIKSASKKEDFPKEKEKRVYNRRPVMGVENEEATAGKRTPEPVKTPKQASKSTRKASSKTKEKSEEKSDYKTLSIKVEEHQSKKKKLEVGAVTCKDVLAQEIQDPKLLALAIKSEVLESCVVQLKKTRKRPKADEKTVVISSGNKKSKRLNVLKNSNEIGKRSRSVPKNHSEGGAVFNSQITVKLKQSNEIVNYNGPDLVCKDVQRTTKNPWNGSALYSGLKYMGAHVSASGGIENAFSNAENIGAKSFGVFLRSQRQWEAKPLDDVTIEKFCKAHKKAQISPHLILPHGSYLLNLGAPKEENLTKSRNLLIEELQRCEKLGLPLYNVHPGSSCGLITKEECLKRIAESINLAHKQTFSVIVVLENMSKQGYTVGGDFSDLKTIIDSVQDKQRVGVCLDTCHAMAAGYNLATEEGFQELLDDFESIVGFEYLVAVHMNDSQGPAGCHKDRHENIGRGKIGLDGFKRIMNHPRFNDIPLILETPFVTDATYEQEIKKLNKLIDSK